jgi:hypothetical protein
MRGGRIADLGPMFRDPLVPNISAGGDRMRKLKGSVPWRRLLFTGATLGMLVLAAGARWKP